MSTSTISQGTRGELNTLVINNQHGKAEVALFGAHVLSFYPHQDGRERLWVSPHADLTGAKPIRGGIPLCWPWFGPDNPFNDETLPSHGFLRTQMWHVESEHETDDATVVTLKPSSTKLSVFSFELDVSLTIRVGNTLSVALNTENNDKQAVKINAALHSYFSIEKVALAEIVGIDGQYKDKLDNWAVKDTPAPYQISSETDRVHLCTNNETSIKTQNYTTTMCHSGHDSLVVWNPWTGAASMHDMDAFGYKNMLCIETALTQWLVLKSGESHTLTQVIS